MARKDGADFKVLPPDLQISFYYRLDAIRDTCLHEALKSTIAETELTALNDELDLLVPEPMLSRVASVGLRGEVFFPTPLVLRANPLLLGYYRLLYGLSQKEFYNKGPFGRFKRLEDRGELPPKIDSLLPHLCKSLIGTGVKLVQGLDELSLDIVHELQLLTLGSQWRGSENNRIGESAVKTVMEIIKVVVRPYIKETTRRAIRIENAAGRPILIEFASDPDVLITEKLDTGSRYVVSIEIKGGSDASNVHNRLGEAEKSHLKAKKFGCVDLWTIIRVGVPLEVAQRASPTTTAFFHLDSIENKRSQEFRQFREQLASRLGIRI